MEQKEVVRFILGRMSVIEVKTQTAYDAVREAQRSLNEALLRLDELDSQRAQVFVVCNALLGEKVQVAEQHRVIDQIAAANRGMSYDNKAFRETMDKINAE
jgi:two-component SAPR family response regulator